MPPRGRKSFLKDRVATTVSIEKGDLEKLHERGIEISDLFRKSVKAALEEGDSPLEQLKTKRAVINNEIDEKIKERERLDTRIKEMEEDNAVQVSKKLQIQEFELERENIFLNKYRKLIFQGTLCEVDFYGNVKKDFKFEDAMKAKEWLLVHYKIKKDGDRSFTEERIKTFLRWDKDLNHHW